MLNMPDRICLACEDVRVIGFRVEGFMEMETPSWLFHVECFVDPRSSEMEHAAAVNAVSLLLLQNKVSIGKIILHMGSYLTTTDHVVRSRGIRFLAELLVPLQTPLEDHVVHCLAEFFTARLDDVASLHGALLGCLALLRRSKSLGTFSNEDALKVMAAFLQHLVVQSLAQPDRFLCFEVLDCILEQHSSAVVPLGSALAFGIRQAIDGERDPRCLLLAFRLVERLGKLFPGVKGPLAEGAADFFDTLSCYFPISFKLRPTDTPEITREDLITCLQNAFAASPAFAAECIPFVLEKLSSSLQDAKLQSLNCLGFCAMAYGANTIAQYARPIWIGLKSELFPSLGSLIGDFGKLKSDAKVFDAATRCLSQCIRAFQLSDDLADDNGGQLLGLLLEDEIVNDLFKYLGHNVSMTLSEGDIVNYHIRTIAQVLSAAARSSRSSSNVISREILRTILASWKTSLNIATLETLISILEAVREVSEQHALQFVMHNSKKYDTKWLEPLYSLGKELLQIFSKEISSAEDMLSMGAADSGEQLLTTCVAGLQCLATFPGYLSTLPEDEAYNLVSPFMNIVLEKPEHGNMWEQAVQSIACICETEERFSAVGKSNIILDTVVPQLVQAATDAKCSDVGSKMFAITAISRSSQSARDVFFDEIQESLSLRDAEVVKGGSNSSSRKLIVILQTLSRGLLPLYDNEHDRALRIATKIWCSVEMLPVRIEVAEEVLIALMELVRVAVSKCDIGEQEIIIQKAVAVLSNRGEWNLEEESNLLRLKENWLIALFSSAAVASRPNLLLLQKPEVVDLFLKASLEGGTPEVSEAIAEALASLLNKWSTTGSQSGLDYVLNYVLDNKRFSVVRDYDEIIMENSNLNACRAVNILAWIAKGLAMRGHIKVGDIAVVFLRVLKDGKPTFQEDGNVISKEDLRMLDVRRAAAKAFGIIVEDSRALNKEHFASVRPLYKQKFFISFLGPFLQALREAGAGASRAWLIRGFSYLVLAVPQVALLSEAEIVFPLVLEGLLVLAYDFEDSDLLHGNLLALSSFLIDGKQVVADHVSSVVNRLAALTQYSYAMAIRQTALQCLGAVVGLPYASIYPSRKQVLKVLKPALDDRKRAVRNEAVRCYQAWQSISSNRDLCM